MIHNSKCGMISINLFPNYTYSEEMNSYLILNFIADSIHRFLMFALTQSNYCQLQSFVRMAFF